MSGSTTARLEKTRSQTHIQPAARLARGVVAGGWWGSHHPRRRARIPVLAGRGHLQAARPDGIGGSRPERGL